MSVYVKLADVLVAPGAAFGDPQMDEYADKARISYAYEVLPGGALAILEFEDAQVRTEITYAAAAWLTVGGKRRGDQR
jgi:hypothetical protein